MLKAPCRRASRGCFLDPIKRHFAGPTKDRKHRLVAIEVDGVVTPLAGCDFAAVKRQNFIEFPAIKGRE